MNVQTLDTTPQPFSEWAVVEVMGHKRFAGFVSEQSLGGASFVRVDVPQIELRTGEILPPFSKLFGAGSIYCISPTTKETALAFAESIRAESFHRFELPKLGSSARPAPKVDEVDEEDRGFDPDDDGDEF